VVCNPECLDQQGCNGAPDWVIEIVSKSTAKKDTHAKYALYEESGVCEYWLVYPSEQLVHQFVLNAETEKYQLIAMFANDEIISPMLFPDLNIDLADVFAE
jgi:Uma2 family endonuclease